MEKTVRLFALSLFATASLAGLARCSPPVIRCETDQNCLSDQFCDVRRSLCIDKEEVIITDDPAADAGLDGGLPDGGECPSGSCP